MNINKISRIIIFVTLYPAALLISTTAYRNIKAPKWLVAIILTNTAIRNKKIINFANKNCLNDIIAQNMLDIENNQMTRCADKLEVKEYVTEKIGEGFTPKTIKVFNNINEIDKNNIPNNCFIKCNHNSGPVIHIQDKEHQDYSTIRKEIKKQLETRYGILDGEWPYWKIKRRAFCEMSVSDDNDTPDYKFHCYKGKTRFLQFIYDRSISPKEVLFDRERNIIDAQLDYNFEKGDHRKLIINNEKWHEMIEISEKLSDSFTYVRVDLYLSKDRIFVGELTFSPRAACYYGVGQEKLLKFFN
jgi:hypothetical protein